MKKFWVGKLAWKIENFSEIFCQNSSSSSKLSKIFWKSSLFFPNRSSRLESFDIIKHIDTFLHHNWTRRVDSLMTWVLIMWVWQLIWVSQLHSVLIFRQFETQVSAILVSPYERSLKVRPHRQKFSRMTWYMVVRHKTCRNSVDGMGDVCRATFYVVQPRSWTAKCRSTSKEICAT